MGSTAMFCEQSVMARESLYFRTLLSVNSYQVTNGKLEPYQAANPEELKRTAPEAFKIYEQYAR